MSGRGHEGIGGVFIVNPAAHSGKEPELAEKLRSLLNKRGLSSPVWKTCEAGEEIELARRALDQGYDPIVAVGGDGTVRNIASVLYGTGRVLGIIPSGTGNDYARSLNLPLSLEASLDHMLQGSARAVDVGFMNEFFFVNVASLGLDARISNRAEGLKRWIRSGWAYKVAIFGEWIAGGSLSIQWEGSEEECLLIAVGKGRTYGGNIPILPEASLTDENLASCRIQRLNRLQFLLFLPKLLRGSHGTLRKYVSLQKGKSLSFYLKERELANVDGEIFPVQGEILFRVDPKSLRVIY